MPNNDILFIVSLKDAPELERTSPTSSIVHFKPLSFRRL